MSNMPNRAMRRGQGGLMVPDDGTQRIPPELQALIEQQQPSKDEQARAAGVQLALALVQCYEGETRNVDIDQFIGMAQSIADFLVGPGEASLSS